VAASAIGLAVEPALATGLAGAERTA